MTDQPKPEFFASPKLFRAWLAVHGQRADALLVGFYRKSTGKPSLTWEESVDEALCFGWIDGIRKRIDEERYSIRFTPRRLGSHWSERNIQRVRHLKSAGRMEPAGLDAFNQRTETNTANYSYERSTVRLRESYLNKLQQDAEAWQYFQELPPSTKRLSVWWVESAKRESTRERRLAQLIECCRKQQRLPQFPQVKARKKK